MLDEVVAKWQSRYPNAMKNWQVNWDVVTPIFKFSENFRSAIYTTNAIKSLNSTFKPITRKKMDNAN